MKCSNCKEEVECCRNCGMPFEEDSHILCLFGGGHICNEDCFFDAFEEEGNGCRTKTIR